MVTIAEIFVCQQCGYCCQGDTTVSLNGTDRVRMLQYLGMEEEEVARRFWRKNGNSIQMRTVDGHCIFFDKGCSIHAGKPWRCTQWPLHPSMLEDQENYEIIKESCPGIRRDLSYEDFCKKFSELLDNNRKR